MIKAVLLDLDDTLLHNPTRPFTEHYLSLLDRFISERLGIQGIIKPLLVGTHAVIADDNPQRTNWDVFYDVLTPTLSVEREAFDAAVNDFYHTTYPQLAAHTERLPGVRPFVDWLAQHGYLLAVATNPLFPTIAVEERLAWAGVPVDEVSYALVASLENMHYAKPQPAFYEEILARLGVQADEALMVGDDWENDIVPATRAGLNTFWVQHNSPGLNPDQPIQPDGSGSLADLMCRVQDENWLETLTPRPLVPAQIIPRLNGNLAALFGIVREVPPHVWPIHPDEEEWSPIEVLYHLAESEVEVQRPRLLKIAAEHNPFLAQPKAPPAPSTRACPESAWMVAHTFAKERRATIDVIAELPPEAWDRPARHTIFGPTTLLEMANFTAQHDRLHFTQLCQTVGKCL